MHSDSLDPAQPRVDTHLKDTDNSYFATNCHSRALPSNVRFATWRQIGAIRHVAPRGGANIISRTTAHRHVAPKNGEFKISIRHFGATWRHKFAKMAPLWRYSALAILWRQILATWRHVAPQSAHDIKYYTTLSYVALQYNFYSILSQFIL